ncbi:hypothetical protein VZT92_013575 [Zoarces viviparus]|uniref:G-protein coupled receptors family 1 profile domain-containing protein n=1 Tax=Zoarces viviparus TaxID=48416 RepID=A0AAW1F4D8_ZOAVI
MATLGGMVSLWSLAVIAFERWLVICKPLGNFIFKPDHALACCAFTWMFALIASVPPLVGWSRYIPEGLQCSCGPDWYTTNNKYNNESYVMFLFCFCFAVTFATIVFCYSQLLFLLKSAAKAQAESASTQKAEREVTRMVVLMTGDHTLLPLEGLCGLQPCHLYVVFNKQFRSAMMKMLGMSGSDDEESSTSASVTQVSKVGPA